MFITDHTAGLAQVRAVAKIVDRLTGLSAPAFDAAWLKAQLFAHKTALVLYLGAAIRDENQDIRALGQGGLPVITKHLGEVIDLLGTTGMPWGGGGWRHGDWSHGDWSHNRNGR